MGKGHSRFAQARMSASSKIDAITSFKDDYAFLSNFFTASVTYEGVDYPTVEHAFQAAKTLDLEERDRIAKSPTPGKAKRLGQKVTLRSDWDKLRVSVMEELVRQKFQKPSLRLRLLATEDVELVEGNLWGDVFWGVSNGQGRNELGKILMRVREDLGQNAA